MIVYSASIICAVIVFGFSLLQLSLTLGAPLGEYVLGGVHKVLPPKMRLVSGAFSCIWLLVGLIYLQNCNLLNIGFSSLTVKTTLIINTAFLAYAIIGNGILTKSKKERYVMTPLSTAAFLCSLTVLILQ